MTLWKSTAAMAVISVILTVGGLYVGNLLGILMFLLGMILVAATVRMLFIGLMVKSIMEIISQGQR